MRVSATTGIASICLFLAGTARAQSSDWQVIAQPGGFKVARVVMSGRATGLALTCERGTPVIAINLAQPPRRNPAALTLRGASGTTTMGVIRNGASNVWVASVKDPRLLDALSSEPSVALSVDGVDYGTASLSSAGVAMRNALAACWRPSVEAAQSNSSAPARGSGPRASANAYPQPILAELQDWASQCREVTGKPGRPGKAVQNTDINGDGRPDYLVFQGAYECDGAASLLAPGASYGVATELYLGQPNGTAAKVWEESTWGPDLVQLGTATAFTFSLSGSLCGDRRGSRVSVAARLSCTLQLRPDGNGKWGLHPLVRGKPVAISGPMQR